MAVLPNVNRPRTLADVVPVIAREDSLTREYFQKLRDVLERVLEILDIDRPEVIPRDV